MRLVFDRAKILKVTALILMLSLLFLMLSAAQALAEDINYAEKTGETVTENEIDAQDEVELSAEEIINKRDDNEYIITAYSEAQMIIKSGGREQIKAMRVWQDQTNALAEFTNPRDRGTKFLKRGDDLWMFFPEAEDLVKISGHMLEQGMMGSDFSYQDMLESDKLTDLYHFELLGIEEYNGRPAYKLEGVKVPGKEVSYYRRIVWIDRERFVGLREELYTESGRLLKELELIEMAEIDGRWYPVHSVMENKLRKNTSTEFIINEIDFNAELPEAIFTLQRLR
ncbi:outer membrane lipoprotein-sorting protein [Halanaerobium sp. Z-7514]|uniref:Outer membrane lipoprotein-sorting protein n=1 Tax=Halanaerobium polyolivorans TaxID=2886943 RepID=A0AAW4WZ94_9FIRM|nr:outer membrane lipoprotein-sorting protein [Halanaerobium polyolivorans]MCC3144690.1 outer membrane lipoprotein-sorting protein [Halanaerobium polyolivorans]RQD73972.1 MAG: outer membrane lipoprotein-sorting protein [Halanaerobium sp. MSAO_Bac5]